ncbi:AAA family ATPase [Mycetocola zhadangensis]|uniref:AAA family ATPase n=1 Tax=Mycetocola zhadangensis TaxID=1164595 RepID=A0A3L7IWT4_9MICO|nr:AAA family ATPase [Mycetocola zhadangensis]
MLVAGVSGTGKTTLAKRIAELLNSTHVELDALFHGPNWTPRPDFLADVRSFIATDTWTTEWQYGSARPLLFERADLLVWLDLPFARVTLPRLLRRTIRRRYAREELWNGNVEPPLNTFFTNSEHIVRWGFQTRHKYRHLVPTLEARQPHLIVVRLQSQREVEEWLAGPLFDTLAQPL